MEISQRVSELLRGHNFHGEIFKGINSVKMLVELRFLFSAHLLMMLCICIKLLEIIFNRFPDVTWT